VRHHAPLIQRQGRQRAKHANKYAEFLLGELGAESRTAI
jgi:hypothetical protein